MSTLIKNIWLLFLVIPVLSFSQNEDAKKHIIKGNELYKKGKYPEAADEYLKAMKAGNDKAEFNLGDAYYRMEKYEDAAKQFETKAEKAKTSEEKAKAYHNLGNSHLSQKKYEESIEAYKKALRQNPKDEATRYNLAYAMSKLKKQEQQNKNQNKDKNQENKDKNKDKNQDSNKDKNQDKNKEKDKEQENKEKEKEQEKGKDSEGKQGEQKPEQGKISKNEAKQMLDALNASEKKLQEKLNKNKVAAGTVRSGKDW